MIPPSCVRFVKVHGSSFAQGMRVVVVVFLAGSNSDRTKEFLASCVRLRAAQDTPVSAGPGVLVCALIVVCLCVEFDCVL